MLTDERIQEVVTSAVRERLLSWLGFKQDDQGTYSVPVLSPSDFQFARAIESAACAERDARIAELEAENGAFGKRQDWWNNRMVELERQLAEAQKDAERWRTFLSTRPQSTHEVINQAIDDAAIRAMKKEQT